MRTSNWIILGILALASVVFVILWVVLGFNVVDSTLDLAITVCWWVVIAATCIVIAAVERRRKSALRTVFVAPGLVYNPEIGIVDLNGNACVPVIKRILSSLTYRLEEKSVNTDSRIRFKYIVHTTRFSDGGNVWEGDVVDVAAPNDPKRFNDAGRLAKLLEGCSAGAVL